MLMDEEEVIDENQTSALGNSGKESTQDSCREVLIVGGRAAAEGCCPQREDDEPKEYRESSEKGDESDGHDTACIEHEQVSDLRVKHIILDDFPLRGLRNETDRADCTAIVW